jgi:hypothetical protein
MVRATDTWVVLSEKQKSVHSRRRRHLRSWVFSAGFCRYSDASDCSAGLPGGARRLHWPVGQCGSAWPSKRIALFIGTATFKFEGSLCFR